MAHPKPEGARVRRNLSQKQWTTFVRGSVPAPALPPLPLVGEELAVAAEYWRDAWAECGPAYTSSTKWQLVRLVILVGQIANGGRVGAQLQTEARQLEETLLLTPKSRRSAWIRVVDSDQEAGADETVDSGAPVADMAVQRSRRARLAAV